MRLTVVLAALLVPAAASANTTITFPAQSLIIPTSASYQDDCGAVSAYGLVYDVLRANATLAHPITIYYAINDTKASPNRCKPTDQSISPAPSGDASWNDGCDFQVTKGGGTPVMLVTNTATSAANDTVLTTIDTTASTTVYPTYASKTVNSSVTTVGYLGGPFVITNNDAAQFLALLDGSQIANDSDGNPIDFTPFRTAATCSFGATHHVNIHRAQVAFSVRVDKGLTQKPPRLALLDTDTNNHTGNVKTALGSSVGLKSSPYGASESGTTATFTTKSNHNLSVGDSVVIAGVGRSGYNGRFTVTAVTSSTTFTVTLPTSGLGTSGGGTSTAGGSILDNYLVDAGLLFAGAQGCPAGGVNAGNANICPNGGVAGQIYDEFDFDDLANNQLALQNRYAMVWTPHWETNATSSTAPSTAEQTAMAKIKTFLDGQTGLMAECASIASYEGSYHSGSADIYTGGLQLQTCKNASGSCGSAVNYGVSRSGSSVPNGLLRNCSDVTTSTGAACAYFGAPSDGFSQTGDYMWNAVSGHTDDYAPLSTTSSMFRPGVVPLIGAVSSLNRTKLSAPGTMIVSYYASRNIKDNTPGKGNILYLAGHNQSGNVPGTKLALQTLLLLGSSTVIPPTTTIETSRSSPIVASVDTGTVSVVQGTFENVTPVQSAPIVTAAADLTNFQFPFVLGHMRATTTQSIGTTGQQLGTGTILFDAASNLPPASGTSCSTPFDGSCRAVFTTTAAPVNGLALRPARVPFQASNADTLGALMAPALTHTEWVKLTSMVVAGQPDGSTYQPALGGVDRSTVAVIPSSQLANASRPTMVYFGATDGMMHAVCASIDTAHGCTSLGRELWAFMPRTQLAYVRLNQTRIDGSPRVLDLFGDFAGTGHRSFRTIMMFHTGGGDPAMYALDVTDPQNPQVVWENTIPNPSAKGAYELGQGLIVNGGQVTYQGRIINLAFVQTNNGGTGPNGWVTTAFDVETGNQFWRTTYGYSAPRLNGHAALAASGMPGGATTIDTKSQGYITDLVQGDLYGNLWLLDAATGLPRFGSTHPLFSFSSDFHPIGVPPTIYSNGGRLFAVVETGGYADNLDTTWGSATQYAVSVALDTPASLVTLSESSSIQQVPFVVSLGAGERGFSQAIVVGTQLFFTTDNSDVNAAAYGTGASSGRAYTQDLGTGTTSSVVVFGGAASLTNQGTTMYGSSSSEEQQLATPAATTVGPSVNALEVAKVSRSLWLRTE